MTAKNVAFWSGGTEDGCSYYRMGLPAAGLRELGVNALANTLMQPASFGVETLGNLDVIVGQRVFLPGPSAIWERLAGKIPLVFEVDDDLFHVNPKNPDAYKVYSLEETKQSLRRNIAMADAVTVTNSHLAEIVSPYNRNVHVVPNFIPEVVLDIPTSQNDAVSVGWSGGASHKVDFEDQSKGPRNFLRKFPQIDYVSAGADYRASMGRPNSEFKTWTSNMMDYYAALDWSVGIVPLKDDLFNRSKSYLKVLEQGARGIPCVATNVGPYTEYIEDGIDGFLVNNASEWYKALRILCFDAEARTEMGLRAKEKASLHTTELNSYRYLDVFNTVTGSLSKIGDLR